MRHNGKHGRTARDPIAVMDALLTDVAEQAAEDHVPTDEEMQWARGATAKLRRQVAQLQGGHRATSSGAPTKRSVVIPAEILALDREALVAHIEILRRGANVRYASLNLTGLSDNDLRTMLAVLLAPER
jgi:hypothetical protein